MKKFALSLLLFAFAWVCGARTAQAAITLTLKGSASTVALGGTLTLTATVSGTTSLGLTWSVNGATNGSAAQGTLTACTTKAPLTCKYTAPSIDVPNPNPMTFKIVSTADSAATATTTATVTDSIAVSLSPSTASVALNGKQKFTATISNSPKNTVLNWYVNGFLNGSTAQGTLGSCTTTPAITCTYTAPLTNVPSPNPAVIKVASAADPAKNKSANVTVTDSIAVTLSPSSATLAVSGKQVFTATITGTTNNALNWYVNGIPDGNASEGTLTACTTVAPWKCTYTAPPINDPYPNPAVIKVASAADPSKNKTANVTVNGAKACMDSGSESLLKGQYAFSLSGYNDTGFLAVVGSVKLDGSGHITAGEADTNGVLGTHTSAINASASSYSVGSNHLGCATIATGFGTFNTRLAVGTITSDVAAEGRIVEWDDPTASSYIVATGHLLQQTTSAFSGGLSGSYAFEMAGRDEHKDPVGMVGVISASSGSLTAGEMDVNDADEDPDGTASFTLVSGTYGSADSNGRFTLTLTWSGQSASHVVDYMVSSSHFLYIRTDPPATNGVQIGDSKQQTGPFSKSSLNAPSAFYTAGFSGGGKGDVFLGILTGNGAGTLSMAGTEDDGGTTKAWGAAGSCGYNVATNGRVTISGTGNCADPFALYLTAPNTGYMLVGVESPLIGNMNQQIIPSGGFSSSSVSGTYYMGDVDVISDAEASGEQVGVAVMTLGKSGFSLTSDYTATYGQNPDETATGPFATVNSNGTISQGGVIIGIVISSTQLVIIDNSTDTYPIAEIMKQ
jgi:hypothetical protein